MHNALRMSRRAFTVAVVAATIAWSIGLAALVTPLTANAAAAGDLVRGSMPAVYYVGSDGKRYVFPNKKTYDTWYSDFSSVMTITDAELAAMPIGGNVTYRPGVKMVKIQTDPKTYAVDKGGTLRWVKTEAVATALYGSAWNTMIDDVPDAFFVNYTIGADVNSASDFNVAAATAGSPTINADKSLGTAVQGLSVSLSAGQPAGGTLPTGAMGVSLLKVDVHNSGSVGINVDSVTLRRTGAGVAADWAAVYVYHGNDRLSTGRTINSTSHEATIGGLNLSVAAGAMETLWFAGDVAAGALAGDVHSFELVSLTSGTTSATGTPLVGSQFTISGAGAGTIAIAPTGTLANVKAGETGAKLAQFQLSTTVEDQNLTKVALFYNGTVTRDNLSNFVLKQGGTTVATASAINSKDLLVFVLSPAYYLERGNVRTFEVFGDVSGSARSGQNVNFYLDQNADLLSIGQTYGYGVTVASTYTAGAAGATATVDAGTLNITYNGPAASDVARRGQDVELFSFTMTAQSNLEIRTTAFGLVLSAGTLGTDITDVKLVDTATGSIVAGPYTAANPTTMTEVINLYAGQARTFKLTADIESTATANATITATLNAFGATAVRNLDNSTYLTPATDIIPSTAITGNPHTIKVPSLTVTVGSVPVSQTYIQGTQGAELYSVGLTAGDATDVEVDTIVLTGRVEDTGGAGIAAANTQYGVEAANQLNAMVLTAKLMNGSTQVGTTKSPTAAGLLTFDNLNLVIPAGQTVGLTLAGNLASGIANLSDDIDFTVRDANTDNVLDGWTATDPDGNSVNCLYTGGPADPATAMDGPDMTIASSGGLNIELAPSDTDSEAGLVVGGSSNQVLAKYKFTAVNEELQVTKVGFTVATANTVASVSLYDGATLVGGPKAITGGGVVNFTGLNFVIPKDSSKVLTVKANMNSVGTSGATTGTAATVTLAATTGTFEARGTGAGSSTLLTDADDVDGVGTPSLVAGGGNPMNAIAAYAKIVRKSKPTVALVSLPTSVLNSGEVVAMRFSVTADAAGDVSLLGLVTQHENGTSAALTAVAGSSGIREVGTASDIAGANVLVAACASGATGCVLVHEFTNEEFISAGSTKTFDVRVNIGVGAATGDSLSSKLLGDTTLATGVLGGGTPATKITVGGTASNFVWSDVSIIPHSDAIGGPSSADWANGTYVKVVPSDQQTLSK